MKALLSFAPLFLQLRRPLLLTLLLSLLTLAAGIGLLGLSGWFLTAAALSTAGAAFNLFAPSAGVRGLSFVRILARYGEKVSGHHATLRLLSELRRWLFARLFPLAPLGRRLGRGDLVSRLLGDVEALDTMFLVALGPLSTATLVGVGMTVLLAVLMPDAALIYALAFEGGCLLVPIGLIALTRRAGTDVVTATSALRQAVLDGIDGHQDIVLFEGVAAAEAKTSAAAEHVAASRIRLGRYGAIASALVQGCAATALLGTLLTGIAALSAGSIDGPLFAGLLLAVIASFEASAALVRSASRLAGAAAAAERLRAIADLPATIAEPSELLPLPGGGTVTFEAVAYGYDPTHPTFTNLNLIVNTGDCVAIVGPSGAGKSTIAHLLVRLADPQAGTVKINGCDVRRVASHELHPHVALMTQDAPVFLDTIRANLLIGRAGATDAELQRVLDDVGLSDLVAGMPGGLDAFVGEAGRTLSAGQARRLCLARTLLSDARIVILDEPTSGLDQQAAASFLADLPRLLAGRTGIVITHADVPQRFSRVYELRAGILSERRP